MGFASPSSDLEHAHYSAAFEHTNGALIEVRSLFIAGPENLDPEDMDEAFADAVALLDGSADFALSGGVGAKTYTTTEEYTP